MKKLLVVLLGLGLGLSLMGCADEGTSTPVLTEDEQTVATAKARLSISDLEDNVTSNFTLTVNGYGNTTITYTSSNTEVVKIDGSTARVTRPEAGEANVNFTLTATITKGEASDTKDFEGTVAAYAEGESSDTLTVAEIRALASGTSVTATGVISALVYGSSGVAHSYLTDETGTIYIYGSQFAATVSVGDEVTITAEVSVYNGLVQIQYATLVSTDATNQTASLNGVQTDKSIEWIKNNLSNLGSNMFELEVTVNVYVGATYTSYSIKDSNDNTFNLYSSGSDSSEFSFLDDYAGQTIKVVVAVQGSSSSSGNPRGQIIAIVE